LEKVRKRFFEQYPMLRLFRDDVEGIINLFEKDYKDAEIIVDEYKLENSSDIDKLVKSQVTNFSVQAFQRYPQETPYRVELLRLVLNCDEAHLSVSDENDTHLRGLASKISSILSQRKSRLHFLTAPPMALVLGVFFSIPTSIILALPWSFSKQPVLSILLALSILLLIALVIIWLVVMVRVRTKKYVVIYLTNSNARSTFFSRNKDELPKMILSAVIGGLVTLILGGIAYFINWLVHLIH